MKDKSNIIIGFSLVAVVLVIGAIFVVNRNGTSGDILSSRRDVFVAEKTGLEVTYPSSLKFTEINPSADQKRGQLWELKPPEDSENEFIITAHYETGASLKMLTATSKQPIKEAVLSNVNLQLPKQYPEYQKISQKDLNINGVESSETIFTYKSRGIKVKQRLLLLFKNDETVVYVRGQSRASEYGTVNEEYLEPVFSSVAF